ncbi:MAG: hypothetical protein ABFS14_04630 [Gemmatimonadota bacterium]
MEASNTQFLQVLTGAILAVFLLLLVWGFAKPTPERKDLLGLISGLLGLLLGAFVQEFRVQDKRAEAEVAEAETEVARQVVADSYQRIQEVERLLITDVSPAAGNRVTIPRAKLDTIRGVLSQPLDERLIAPVLRLDSRSRPPVR